MIKAVCLAMWLLMFHLNVSSQTKNNFAKNKIKFSTNYAFSYAVNAYIIGADNTKKKGFLYQLEYYRNIHKRLAIGLSAGYAKGVDRNNPELDLLDYEISKYIHLGLQGFIINNYKNRLFVKLSSGITHTDRLNSTIRVSPWHQERGLQYSNGGGWGGITGEICYDRQISKNIFVSLNLGTLVHNDGADFAGCAIGYAF